VQWCQRFRAGTVRLEGALAERFEAEGLALTGSRVELVFTFAGGPSPEILTLAVVGALEWTGTPGMTLEAAEDSVHVDECVQTGLLRTDLFLVELLRALSDVTAFAQVIPDGEVVVKFQHGVQATISPNAVVSVSGRACGPPNALRLADALTMEVDGEGVRLSHQRFHRLASLANVRIEGASLHPNGEVRLRGGAQGQLDRLVRGGLRRASVKLSDLVRRSPRFARVRRILQEPGS
jgi:hypothetical protein